MDQVKVLITTHACSDRYGDMKPGDVVVTDAAYARHLVVDCGAGEYENQPAPKSSARASKVDPSDDAEAAKAPARKPARKEKAGDDDNG